MSHTILHAYKHVDVIMTSVSACSNCKVVTNYTPTVQVLMDLLHRPGVRVNHRDENLNAPLHSLVRSNRKDKLDLIITLLTHSDADVNLKGDDEMTPLHFAVQVC